MSVRLIFDPSKSAQLHRALELLPRRVAIKHLRIGMNAWGGVVRDMARATVRRQTGLLAKSLTVKVKIPDASFNQAHHGKPAYALVGAARNVVGPVADGKLLSLRKATKRVLSGGKVQTRRPSRYAHLVERRYPFMGPAQAAGETVGLEKLRQKLEQGIASEAAALANK